MRGRRLASAAALVIGLSLAIGFFSAASALAAGFSFKEVFGSGTQPLFTKPMGMVVDPATGDLLVIDVGAKTISRFNPDGTPANFSALGTNVIDGKGTLPCVPPSIECDGTPQNELTFGVENPREIQIAIDDSGGPTDGDIYVNQPRDSHNLIDVFASSGAYLEQLTEFSAGQFGITTGLSVDGSGAVYVDDPNHNKIHKYAPSVNPVTNGDNVASLDFETGAALASGSGPTAGRLYANVYNTGQLRVLNSSTGSVECEISAGNILLAVNSVDGHILAATESEVREYEGTCPKPASPLRSFAPAGGGLQGMAIDGSRGLVYVTRLGSPKVEVWEVVKLPEATTGIATPVGVSTATLRGEVNPNGLPLTKCFFEYGKSVSYGSVAQCEAPNAGEVGEETSLVPVHAAVGLESGTAYHFRLRAENTNGLSEDGKDETLHTLGPAISGQSISQVTATSGQASATIDPNGEPTTYSVQYVSEENFLTSEWAQALVAPVSAATLTLHPTGTGGLFAGTGTGNLSAASGDGTLVAGSALVSGVSTSSGSFAVGQSVSGVGIPEGTTVAAVDVGTLTLSKAAEVSGPVTLTARSNLVTGVVSLAGAFEIGQTITGTGIPAGTRITAISDNGTTLALDRRATAAGVSVALSAGSTVVSNLLPMTGRFAPGQTIEGLGIPAETTIISASQTQLVLSKPATAALKRTSLTASGPQPVVVQLTGLLPGSAYRFRFVAANANAANAPGGRFVTAQFPGAPLPDHRAYEMVTPNEKRGEVIPPQPTGELGPSCGECLPGGTESSMPMQAAPDGNSVLYVGQPFAGGLASGLNEYVSGRGGAGWNWASLSSPITTGVWQAFSSTLSRGVLAQAEPALDPAAPTRGGRAFRNLYLWAGGSARLPLLTVEPPHRDPQVGSANQFQIRFSGGNSGTPSISPFTHIVVEANDALSAADPTVAPAAPEVPAQSGAVCAVAHCNLYEWAGSQLHLVNVAPGNGVALGESVVGSGYLLTSAASFQSPNVSHAVSADGSKVFWSSGETGHVYARVDGTRTLEIPGPATCQESVQLNSRTCFLTASTDGSHVLLSNGMINVLNKTGTAYESGADLSEGQVGFQGILGASEDLSRIYFIDTAALPASAGDVNANGEEAEAGKFNLYAYDEGVTSFVGILLNADNGFSLPNFGAWQASSSSRTAQVSSDGLYVAFMSKARLTGYDNSHAGGGECPRGDGTPACFEVFEYAAQDGSLSCASCRPSDVQPGGYSNLTLLQPGRQSGPLEQPGNLSIDGHGRLFFESQDSILPQDTNGGTTDVYEWEPNGLGTCSELGGCVSLVSSGHGSADSLFLDSTPSGNDAFFVTRSQLLPQDKDDQLDLYDARVDGGFPEEVEGSCIGEACRAALAAPPLLPSGGSSVFSAPPESKPKACKSGYVKRQGKCVKKKSKAKKKKGSERNNQGGDK